VEPTVHAVKEFGYPAPSRVLKLGIRYLSWGPDLQCSRKRRVKVNHGCFMAMAGQNRVQ
jgi:hypothetical protein